jgi:hypothetical protein
MGHDGGLRILIRVTLRRGRFSKVGQMTFSKKLLAAAALALALVAGTAATITVNSALAIASCGNGGC